MEVRAIAFSLAKFNLNPNTRIKVGKYPENTQPELQRLELSRLGRHQTKVIQRILLVYKTLSVVSTEEFRDLFNFFLKNDGKISPSENPPSNFEVLPKS